jgi:hypothetical protein
MQMDVDVSVQEFGLPDPDVEMRDVDAQIPRMMDVPDQDDRRSPEDMWYTQSFPEKREAGKTYGASKTSFERIRDDQILAGCEILGPFADDEEWELAKWLIKNVGHNQTETFLKLPIVSTDGCDLGLRLTFG